MNEDNTGYWWSAWMFFIAIVYSDWISRTYAGNNEAERTSERIMERYFDLYKRFGKNNPTV